jgi:hypothetical protein
MIADFDDNGNFVDRERTARLALELCDDLSKFERAVYNIEVCYELYEKYPMDSLELREKVCYFIEQFFETLPCKPSVLKEKCNLICIDLKSIS